MRSFLDPPRRHARRCTKDTSRHLRLRTIPQQPGRDHRLGPGGPRCPRAHAYGRGQVPVLPDSRADPGWRRARRLTADRTYAGSGPRLERARHRGRVPELDLELGRAAGRHPQTQVRRNPAALRRPRAAGAVANAGTACRCAAVGHRYRRSALRVSVGP